MKGNRKIHMNLDTCHIIGIDCATQDNKRGVAVALFDGNECFIESAEKGLDDNVIGDKLVKCRQDGGRVLLALDAPLGWPTLLGRHLAEHEAGKKIPEDNSHKLFRRATDRFIKDTYGIQSLDVGADRIARTAHSALKLLEFLRGRSDSAIPLATDKNFQDISAIEVYPTATLKAHGLKSQSYKKAATADKDARENILRGLEELGICIKNEVVRSNSIESADALDAIACVLAGMDFLKGNAYPPESSDYDYRELAVKEGWIWVKRK